MLDFYDSSVVMWILDWVMVLVSIGCVVDVFCPFLKLVLNANCTSIILCQSKKKQLNHIFLSSFCSNSDWCKSE